MSEDHPTVEATGMLTEGRAAPLRAAVAGTGLIGAVHVRSARLAGAEVVGVAASTRARSAEAAERLGVGRAFATAEELVEADDVDVVHLCTPNDLHAPLAETALRAGKHVVCEKPLAMDAAQADRLTALARETGLTATVPFVYRYNPVVVEARTQIAAGALGPVRVAHGGYVQDWLSQPEDDSWRVDPERSGGSRTFADIGSHWCDLLEFVTGDRIAALVAQTSTVIAERGGRAVSTEDLATMMLRTEAGVLATMLVSQVSPGRKNHLHLEVACAEASIRFEQERPDTLWVGRRERTEQLWRDPDHLSPAAARLAILPAGHTQGYFDCFDLFMADTYAAIAGAAPDELPRFADGARANRIVDAVLRSAANQEWVDVGETRPGDQG